MSFLDNMPSLNANNFAVLLSPEAGSGAPRHRAAVEYVALHDTRPPEGQVIGMCQGYSVLGFNSQHQQESPRPSAEKRGQKRPAQFRSDASETNDPWGAPAVTTRGGGGGGGGSGSGNAGGVSGGGGGAGSGGQGRDYPYGEERGASSGESEDWTRLSRGGRGERRENDPSMEATAARREPPVNEDAVADAVADMVEGAGGFDNSARHAGAGTEVEGRRGGGGISSFLRSRGGDREGARVREGGSGSWVGGGGVGGTERDGGDGSGVGGGAIRGRAGKAKARRTYGR